MEKENVKSVWPSPLVENFSDPDWPKFTGTDEEISAWALANKRLLLRTVTWNMCAKPPPPKEKLCENLLTKKFHIYVIGTEECERSIAQSAINPSKKNWEIYLSECFGNEYVPVRSHTLQAIHLIVFVHRAIAPLCSIVTSAAVATGVGNTLGNKGGVAVYLKVGSTRILIINSHLSAHQKAVKQRNSDYQKIVKLVPYLLEKKETDWNVDADNNRLLSADPTAASAPSPILSPTSINSNVDKPVSHDMNQSANTTVSGVTNTDPSKANSPNPNTTTNTSSSSPDNHPSSTVPINNPIIAPNPSHPSDSPNPLSTSTSQPTPSPADPATTSSQPLTLQPPALTTPPTAQTAAPAAAPAATLPTATAADEDSDSDGEEEVASPIAAPERLSEASLLQQPLGKAGDRKSIRTLSQCADVVIFMGDLNYRIHGNRSIVDKLIQANMHEVLLGNDQLKMNMKQGLVLENFTEPPLNFRPTYKYDVGSSEYDTGSKKRIPSWTDRILYIANDSLSCLAYNSEDSIMTSDHRPVYASFMIQFQAFVSLDDQQNAVVPNTGPVKFTSESQVCNIM